MYWQLLEVVRWCLWCAYETWNV